MSKEVEVYKYGDPEKGAEKGAQKGVLELIIKVTTMAKTLSPKDDGLLENSIMWKTRTKKGGLTEGKEISYTPKQDEGVVGSATEYAVYQEFGTRHMAAHPYLRPAIEVEALGNAAGEVMKKYCFEEMKKALKKRKKVNI